MALIGDAWLVFCALVLISKDPIMAAERAKKGALFTKKVAAHIQSKGTKEVAAFGAVLHALNGIDYFKNPKRLLKSIRFSFKTRYVRNLYRAITRDGNLFFYRFVGTISKQGKGLLENFYSSWHKPCQNCEP